MTEADGSGLLDAPVGDAPFDDPSVGRRTIRGGALRAGAVVVGMLGGGVSAPLVVRHLGNAAFGRYQTVLSIAFIATALSEGGLAFVAVRTYATADPSQRRRLVANLMGMRLALELPVAAAMVLFGVLVGYPAVMLAGLLLAGISLVIAAQQATLTVILQGQLRLAALASTELANQLLVSILLVALVVAGARLTWFFAVQPVVWIAVLAMTLVLVGNDAPRVPSFDLGAWRSLARETALYAAASGIAAINYPLIQVAMSVLEPGAQTGYYAVALRIIAVANTIPWVLGGSLLPVLSAVAKDLERMRYIAERAIEGSAIVGGWFVLAIVVGAPLAIAYVGGDHASVTVLRILGVSAGATFVLSCWTFVLLAQQRNSVLLAVNAAVLALTISLSAALIPPLGARGGALCTVCADLVLVGTFTAFMRRSGIAPRWPWLGRWILALVLGFGAALALVGAIGGLTGAGIGAAGGSAAYFLTLQLVGAIPSELRDALPGRRGRWA